MSKFELVIELIKTCYPIVCFGLAGIISVSAIVKNTQLSGERWTGILGLAGGAITAGAGIAQAPHCRRLSGEKGKEE